MFKKNHIVLMSISWALLLMLAGCGGGGDSTAVVNPGVLKLTLTTSDAGSGVLIGGIQGTITLPAGTTLDVEAANPQTVQTGKFSLTENAADSLATNSFVAPVFTFGVIKASGFSSGDFATVVVRVTSGSPAVTDFPVSSLKVVDIHGNYLNVAVSLK